MNMQFPIHLILDEIDWDPRVALPIAQEIGVEACAIRMFNQNRYPKVPAEDQAWVEELYDKGICRFDVITPAFNKDLFDPAKIEAMVTEELPLSIQCARRLGARDISLFSWAKPADALLPTVSGGLSPSMPFEPIVQAFRRMAEVAGREGMRILIKVGYQCWGDTGLGVAQIMRAVDHPNLRMLWDPSNSLSGRVWWSKQYPQAPIPEHPMQTLLGELDSIADLIGGIHVRDMIIKPPAWEYVFLGEGVIDWPVLTRALWDHGYRGALTIEHHIPAPRKEAATRHSMQYLKQITKED